MLRPCQRLEHFLLIGLLFFKDPMPPWVAQHLIPRHWRLPTMKLINFELHSSRHHLQSSLHQQAPGVAHPGCMRCLQAIANLWSRLVVLKAPPHPTLLPHLGNQMLGLLVLVQVSVEQDHGTQTFRTHGVLGLYGMTLGKKYRFVYSRFYHHPELSVNQPSFRMMSHPSTRLDMRQVTSHYHWRCHITNDGHSIPH